MFIFFFYCYGAHRDLHFSLHDALPICLRQQRAALLVQADSEAYLQYVQLMGFFSSRGGVVLSPAIRGVCKACGSRILPNDEVKLHQNHQLVRCKSCGRILYLPKT